jgi:hypothetical protein
MAYTQNDRTPANPTGVLCGFAILAVLALTVASYKLQIRPVQWAEASYYLLLLLCAVRSRKIVARWRLRKQQEPFTVPRDIDERELQKAWKQEAILAGYTPDRKPWIWTDEARTMQAVAGGINGSGKSTLLTNIVSQDLMRWVGPPGNRRRIPLLIFDGKGDAGFFQGLLPHIHRAGRMEQLRVLNPSRPEISSRFNPFWAPGGDYMARVDMIFGAFNLDPRGEFFPKHQLTYLQDIVRVLYYTGRRYQFYDTIVMMLDELVLREQIDLATRRIEREGAAISAQQRLNFQMSARNLLSSLKDSRRIEKIQGLINECMTFTNDKLAAITGHYDDLLTVDEVLDQGLILFVSLNANKDTDPTIALGKMILQNVQLAVGTLYEDTAKLQQPGRPLFSVIFDEFAPFIYPRFPHILHTARGSKTAFLFSFQALPQLEGPGLGRSFKLNVYSGANTIFMLRIKDEDTTEAFTQASGEQNVIKESVQVERSWFGRFGRYRESGRATQREEKETRTRDWDVKNLPKGRMQALVGDDTLGVVHSTVQVRPATDIRIPGWEPGMLPVLERPQDPALGANLRLKQPEAQREFEKQRTEFEERHRDFERRRGQQGQSQR